MSVLALLFQSGFAIRSHCLMFVHLRRDGRVVEGTPLLREQRVKPLESSNLSLSATYYRETVLSPTIEPTSRVRNKIRPKETGSLKKKIPMIAVPAAPMPVQTA